MMLEDPLVVGKDCSQVWFSVGFLAGAYVEVSR
jgi:hypothetical protein